MAIEALQTSLSTLLGKARNDPWSLLMIQTLLWSFRRWAIYYLTENELTTSMREFVWESHLDLVDRFAPEGLRDFAIVWLNPNNVGDRVDMLEELNEYFMSLIDAFDHAIQTDNDDEQNDLAVFIDETITEIIDTWLDGRTHYRIYPTQAESPDSFSTTRIFAVMQTILDKFIQPVATAATAAPEVTQEAVSVPVPEAAQESQSAPQPQPPPQPQPEPVPSQAKPIYTLSAAFNRRRTMRASRLSSTKHTRRASKNKA